MFFANSSFAVETNINSNNSGKKVISTTSDSPQQVVVQSQKPARLNNLKFIKKVKHLLAPSTLVLIVLCFFIPFLAVGLKTDWSISVLWNLLWCCLGVIPGIIHALIVVTR